MSESAQSNEELLPELRTARFRLRIPSPEDAERLHAIYSAPSLLRFIAHAQAKSVAEMRGRLEGHVNEVQRRQAARWMVEDAKGTVVAYVAMFHWSTLHQVAEIGYAVAHDWWNKQVMRELMPALIDFGFGPMDLMRIEALVDEENGASLRVLEREGFVREGLLRSRSNAPGARRTAAVILGLLRHEWEARQSAR